MVEGVGGVGDSGNQAALAGPGWANGVSGECPVVQPSEILSKGLIKVIASQPCTKRAEV